MTPLEFMARLAALIPPARLPLVRYHGVFASRSSFIVPPSARDAEAAAPCGKAEAVRHGASGIDTHVCADIARSCRASLLLHACARASTCCTRARTDATGHAAAAAHACPRACAGGARRAERARRSHEDQRRALGATMEDGELLAQSRYVEWAVMRKRSRGFDVLVCPRCSHKMTVLATITDPEVVRKILDPLRVRSTPLPRAPARAPTWVQTELGFYAA
jgi:hypothetical protein